MVRKKLKSGAVLFLSLVILLSTFANSQIFAFAVDDKETASADEVFETIINDASIGDDVFNFKFSAGWSTSTGYPDSFYNGDEHWVHIKQDSDLFYELKFYGTKIELYGVKESSGAICEVSIDGEAPEDMDTYNSSRKAQSLLYAKENLAEGVHTIRVNPVYRRNEQNTSGYTTEIDFAKATHPLIPVTDVEFEFENITIEKGISSNIKANVIPSYATKKEVIYRSENEAIAKVNELGEIIGLGVGTTKIIATVKDSALFAEVTVEVTPKTAPIRAFMGSTDFNYLQENYNDYFNGFHSTNIETGWIGDVINAKVVALTKKIKINNAVIASTDFLNKNGDTIDSENIEITWIKETMANIGRGNRYAPVKPFPDILYTKEPINIAAQKVQSAWINVNIPRSAKPGNYSGTITVNADELEAPIALPYSFEVLDVVQPHLDDTETQIELWQHPYTCARYYGLKQDELFTEEHFKYLRPQQEAYRDMGGRAIVANIVEEAWNHQSYDSDPTMIKWTKKSDGSFSFDYDHFDKWIQFNIDLGILDPAEGRGQIKCYSILPWGNQITYFDEASNQTLKIRPTPGDSSWTAYWTAFLQDFIKHLEEKGWFDITYISMDERSMKELSASLDLIESIKNSSEKHLKTSCAMNYKSGDDYSFLDRLSDISIGISYISPKHNMVNFSQHRREKNLLTTIYNCTGDYPNSFVLSDPAESAWIMWYSLLHNSDGFLRWSWDGWVENPLENVSYKFWEPGDPFFIYPGDKDAATPFVRSSPRLERFKQGVRDINKAKYLMEKSPELKSQIKELVASLKLPNGGGNGYGSCVAASQSDRDLLISEVNRMRKGIHDVAKKYIDANTPTLSATPVIEKQPDAQTVTQGNPAVFSVTASALDGGVLTYQWQMLAKEESAAWADISGATNATYQIAKAALEDSGKQFRCIVTNTKDSRTPATATSNAAELTVKEASETDKKIKIVTDPQAKTVALGTEVSMLGLPGTVTVTLEDDTTAEVRVLWNTDGYDGSKAGEYTFNGTLAPQAGIVNSDNITVNIKVTVKEQLEPSKETLVALIATAKEMAKDSKYTQKSRDALTKAIATAQAVAGNDNATVQEITNAQKALQNSIKALMKQGGESSPAPKPRKHIEPNMVSSSALSEKVASSSKGADISVRSDYKVATGFLNDLVKNKEKSVTLNGDWYSWTLDGKNIENTMPGVIWFDTRITTDSPNADAIAKLTEKADTTNLHFNYEGKLPGETVIRAQLEKYAGKSVYIYYHNPEKGRLELIQADVKADELGWMEFTVTTGADYVISPTAIKGAVTATK